MERIKGFPDYSITRCGRVFSHRTKNFKELKPSMNRDGYKQLTLIRCDTPKPIKLHQILAIHFLNHTLDGHTVVVDHIDGDKLNNNIENLQLISQRENTSKDQPSRDMPLGVCRQRDKYQAQIRHGGKNIYLGMFRDPEEASQAYQNKLAEIESEEG